MNTNIWEDFQICISVPLRLHFKMSQVNAFINLIIFVSDYGGNAVHLAVSVKANFNLNFR